MANASKSKLIKIISVTGLILLAAALFVFASRSNKKTKSFVKDGFFFDTYVSFTVYSAEDSKYLEECLGMCRKYQALFDKNTPGSDIYRINNAGTKPVKVDIETYNLLSDALEICNETEGKIDITVENLILLWGFENEIPPTTLPNKDDMAKALELTDYKAIVLSDGCTVTKLNKDIKIDPGFIAKGYIADKIGEFLKSKGVESALINLGGNILVIGSKPNGDDFTIGIKDPVNPDQTSGSVNVSNKSVVTSGTYERYVTVEGKKYHHILDPQTGYPAESEIQSVTIISDSSEYGDALSTACLILGEKESQILLDKYNAKAIFK